MADERRSLTALQTLEADNVTGLVTPQILRDHLISTHPEKVVQAGVTGSEPASPLTGDLYLPSDGYVLKRFNGSAWGQIGPVFPLTPPEDGGFSWVNQGGASVDTTKGGIYLLAPKGGSQNLRMRVKAAPSTPYTITAALLGYVLDSVYQDVGLCFRESSTGKLVVLRLDSTGLCVTTASGPTAWVTNLFGPSHLWGISPLFYRIADDGANLTFSLSSDGQHFIQLWSAGRTAYLAGGPNQVGFFANDQTNFADCGVTLLSWKEGS